MLEDVIKNLNNAEKEADGILKEGAAQVKRIENKTARKIESLKQNAEVQLRNELQELYDQSKVDAQNQAAEYVANNKPKPKNVSRRLEVAKKQIVEEFFKRIV